MLRHAVWKVRLIVCQITLVTVAAWVQKGNFIVLFSMPGYFQRYLVLLGAECIYCVDISQQAVRSP